MVLGYLLAAILSFSDFFSESIHIKARKSQIISFAAGVSITYLFLILLPEVYTAEIVTNNKFILLATLFAFSIFHLADKYVHQKFKGTIYRNAHSRLHANMSFLTLIIVGFLLVKFSEHSKYDGLILFIPLFFHVIIDALPKRVNTHIFSRFFYAIGPLIGAIIARFAFVSLTLEIILLSFVGGAILYTVLREDFPENDKEKPYFFILGLIFYLIITIIFWYFL